MGRYEGRGDRAPSLGKAARRDGEREPRPREPLNERRRAIGFFAVRNPDPAGETTLTIDAKAITLKRVDAKAVTGCRIVGGGSVPITGSARKATAGKKTAGSGRVPKPDLTGSAIRLSILARWTAAIADNRSDAGHLVTARDSDAAPQLAAPQGISVSSNGSGGPDGTVDSIRAAERASVDQWPAKTSSTQMPPVLFAPFVRPKMSRTYPSPVFAV